MMRLGFSPQDGYLIILSVLILLIGAGTIYGLWAQGRATSPEAALRLRISNSRVRLGWWLIAIFAIAWSAGQGFLVLVFAVFSFFLLREFIALTPIKPSDHWGLVIAFYVAIPVQYALVYFDMIALFTLFIPVYIFLLLPVVATLSQDTDRYLERVAKVQWGIMTCVFCVSHAPAIATLDFVRYSSSGPLMLLWFLVTIFCADLFSVVASSALGGRPLRLNPNKTIKGLAVGAGLTFLVSVAIFLFTPFRLWQAALYSLAMLICCFLGDAVISSVKRSLGAGSWESEYYMGRGILSRFAPIIFAAPVFYHLTVLFFHV